MEISKKELEAKAENSTYLGGLIDASKMSKKELNKAVEYLLNSTTD